MRTKFLRTSIAAIAIFASAAAAQVNVQWLQPSNGNWFDPLNWQQLGTNPPSHVVPNGPLDSAFIATPESSVVTLDSAVTLDRFTLTAPNTLLGGGSLTTRTFDHTGMISGGVRVDVTEEFNSWAGFMNSATLSLSGKVSAFLILLNDGTVGTPPNTSRIELHGRVEADQLYLQPGAFQAFPSDALMTNHGTLLFTGTSGFTTTPFRNMPDATVIAQAADFEFANGVTGGGTYIINKGRQLTMAGTLNLAPETTVRGPGTLRLNFVTTDLNFDLSAENVSIQWSRIRLNRDLNVTGRVDFATDPDVAGTLSHGRANVRAGGVLRMGNLDNPDTNLQAVEVVNDGRLVVSGIVRAAGTASITNNAVMEFSDGGAVAGYHATDSGTLINHGAIVSHGYTSIVWPLHNTGSVEVVKGSSLGLAKGMTGNGSLRVAQEGTLRLNGTGSGVTRYFDQNAVTIDGSLNVESFSSVAIDRDLEVRGRLDVNTGNPLVLAGNLTVRGDLHLARRNFFPGAQISGGRIIAHGPAYIGTGGALPEIYLNDGAEIQLHDLSDLQGSIKTDTSATVINRSTMRITGGFVVGGQGTGSFVNHGAVEVIGGGGSQWNVENNGSIVVKTGVLTLGGGLTGQGTVHVDPGARLSLGNAQSRPQTYFETGTLDCRGGLDVFTGGAPVTIATPVLIPGDLRLFTTNGYQPAIFMRDVHAALVTGGGGIFHGRVETDSIVGGSQFNGPVVASSVDLGSAEFNGGTNTIGFLKLGVNVKVNGNMEVTGSASLERGATVNGVLHVRGPVQSVELHLGGIGTTIFDGPIHMSGGTPSTPSVGINGGTVILRGGIISSTHPSFAVERASSNVFFLTSQRFRESNLASGRIYLAPHGNQVLSVRLFPSIPAIGSLIDLADNMFIADYTSNSPFIDIAADVFTGYANGAWNGPGIFSSVAGGNSEVGIGVAEASAIFGSFPATITGETVDSTTVIARYTLRGDANLDRIVDIRDFALLAPRFNSTGFWHNGDFNYDFTVNVADFAILAANFNRTMSFGEDGARGAAVPEPTIATVGLLAAIALRRR